MLAVFADVFCPLHSPPQVYLYSGYGLVERKQKLVSEGAALHTERNLPVYAVGRCFEIRVCCQSGLVWSVWCSWWDDRFEYR